MKTMSPEDIFNNYSKNLFIHRQDSIDSTMNDTDCNFSSNTTNDMNNSFSFEKEEISQPITKERVFTLTSASSVESICEKNDNNITDIDELVKYISEDTEKKPKKKKNKKSKKSNTNNVIESVDDDFDKEFEIFKKDIEKNSVYPNIYHKSLPYISEKFIKSLDSIIN